MRNAIMATIAGLLATTAAATDFRVTMPASGVDPATDGRLILIISPNNTKEIGRAHV